MKLLLLLAALASVSLRPAAADPHRDHRKDQSHRGWVWVTPEEVETQKSVFPGHDGHIMPPTPQDWADYHAAEARAAASRPLFPCLPPPGDHGKRLY